MVETSTMNGSVLLINWRDTRNPEAGGAETYYHEIFSRLASRGLSVTVLAHRFRGAAREEVVDGVRVVRTGSRWLFNVAAVPWVLRHARRFDLIIEDLNKIPFFTPLFVRQRRLHLVMHFFGTAIFREVFFLPALYVFCAERVVRLVYRNERFVAISRSTCDEISSFCRKPAAVVEPGIDTRFYHPCSPKSRYPTILCVTRLKRYKNVQFLIRSLSRIRERIPQARLIIAGSGEYRRVLERIAREQGLEEAVEFTGFVSRERKRELLSQAWVFVNPSVKEGWGISTIEAALCGTVTVASDVAGLRDSVRDGETGWLFRYGDSAHFCERTLLVLCDNALRDRMQERAREFALGFDWELIARSMEAQVRRALDE